MGAQESTSPYLYKQKATADNKSNEDLKVKEKKLPQKKIKSEGPIIISFDKPNNLPYHIEEINETGYCLRRINEISMMYDINACSNDLIRRSADNQKFHSNVFLNFQPYTKECLKIKVEKRKKEETTFSKVKVTYGNNKNNEVFKPPQNSHAGTKGITKNILQEKFLDSNSTNMYSSHLINLTDHNTNNNTQSGIEIAYSNFKFCDLQINNKIAERNIKPVKAEKRNEDEEKKNTQPIPSEKSFLNTSGFLKKLEENKMKEQIAVGDKSDILSKISANKSLDNSFEKSVIRSYKYIFEEKNEKNEPNEQNQRSLTPELSSNKQEKLFDYLQKNPNIKNFVEKKSPNTSTLASSSIMAKQKQQYTMISKLPNQESGTLNIKLNLNQFQKKSPDRSGAGSQTDRKKNILQLQREKMGWKSSTTTPREYSKLHFEKK